MPTRELLNDSEYHSHIVSNTVCSSEIIASFLLVEKKMKEFSQFIYAVFAGNVPFDIPVYLIYSYCMV